MPGFVDTVLPSTKYPIYLRCPQVSDAATYAQILSNPQNIRHDPSDNGEPMKVENAEKTITAMRKSASEEVPTRVNFVIVYTGGEEGKEEEVIGLSGFGGIDLIDGKRYADVGVMINPEYRGRGYALECLRLCIDFAFEKLATEGVSCQTRVVNTEMVGVLEKFGWKGGVRRESEKGAEFRYEMSPEEWAEMKMKSAN
ncbi:acetyltransferase [Xylogone sp. PMI_703]|nr:acetyltransferase [Xylogone sp. PMI_703]